MPRQTYTWTPGQKVFEPSSRSHWGGSPGRALTIDRVTPSGRAVIGARQYDPDGWPRGNDGRGGSIVPFTPEHQEAIDLWKLRLEADQLAENIRWRTLDRAALEIALPALRALNEEPKG